MIEPATDASVAAAVALLIHYSFDLGGYNAEQLIGQWLNDYPANWVRLAVIEALYQGRYKAVSVTQILSCWQRRKQPIYHFNHEFERLVSNKFPQSLTAKPDILRENDEPVDVMVRSLAQKLRDRVRPSVPNGTPHAAIAATTPPPSADQGPDTPPVGISTFSQQPPTPTIEDRVGTPIITSHVSRLPKLLPPSQPPQQPSLSPTPVVTELPTLAGQTPSPSPVIDQGKEKKEADFTQLEREALNTQPVKATHQPDWSRADMSKRPIDCFTPTPERSEFYTKLKAVAQQSDDTLPGEE